DRLGAGGLGTGGGPHPHPTLFAPHPQAPTPHLSLSVFPTGTPCGSFHEVRSRTLRLTILCLAMASPSMAKDEGLIAVKKLSLQGVTAVDQSRLKAVLATGAGSRLPGGQKRFFDRTKFELVL